MSDEPTVKRLRKLSAMLGAGVEVDSLDVKFRVDQAIARIAELEALVRSYEAPTLQLIAAKARIAELEAELERIRHTQYCIDCWGGHVDEFDDHKERAEELRIMAQQTDIPEAVEALTRAADDIDGGTDE